MPYEVEISEEDGYIRVAASGERIPGSEEADAIQVWSRVAEVCHEKQVNLILAIYNVTGHLPARAAHAIAYAPDRFGWSRRFRLALVDLNEESRQDVLFGEDVAVSSGYEVRIFDKERDAKEWLVRR